MALARALGLIREVPDYPKPGVLYRDITPLLADAGGFAAVIAALARPVTGSGADVVVGVEARGFVLGAAVALAAGVGLATVRKAGKLPRVAGRQEYQLEYGSATLELPEGVLRPGDRAWLVDDVLATGGTLRATVELVERAGAAVAGVGVLLELDGLHGRDQLPGRRIEPLLTG